MAASNTQMAVLQSALLPAVLQSFLAELCSRALLTFLQSTYALKGSCGTSTITCMTNCLHHGETRHSDFNLFVIQSCSTCSSASDIDEENSSEKCGVSILDEVPAPEVAGRVSRQHFSEWLLVAAKTKDEEDEDEDDEDDDDDDEEGDEDDDEGDDEEGDDEVGGGGEGAKGEDEDDEEDEADDDDEDEDDDDDDEEDDEDEDESPPKKLRK